jgi:magnesium chelatase family protein
MLYKTLSAAVYGIDANIIEVEVDVSGIKTDEDHFHTVGLPDAAVRESRDRVRAALRNCGYDIPLTHITINLAPADIKKEGSGFDLPMALGILGAYGGLNKKEVPDCLFVGELSLDGSVRRIRGALPIAIEARGRRISRLVVPELNAKEAAMVSGVIVYPVKSLLDVIHFVNTGNGIEPTAVNQEALLNEAQHFPIDFKDVRGQQTAKRALEVACAGGHNILMIGPPGSGKTMLAKRVPTILPPFTFEEALETTKIHSVAGVLDPGAGLVGLRPFRSPHHTISDAGLIGGGIIPRPGEVSLAHNGVLFLDELPEFPRNVLEVMRQPLEDGTVCIARAAMSLTFPARFMLAAAMNPCPCGFFNDRSRECRCTQPMIQRYMQKISGPLMDRIDIHIDVPAVNYKEMRSTSEPEGSAQIRERVMRAREIQLQRFKPTGTSGFQQTAAKPSSVDKLTQAAAVLTEAPNGVEGERPQGASRMEPALSERLQGGSRMRATRTYCNAQMTPRQIRTFCELSADCERLLERAMMQQGLTARAHDRILKVARTIADLEGEPEIQPKHIAEAIQYRTLDRTFWA